MRTRLWGSFVRRCHRSPPSSYSYTRPFSTHHITREIAPSKEEDRKEENGKKGRWVTLPPFDMSTTGMTTMKWIRRCCPSVPVSLIHKLFRLRKVQKRLTNPKGDCGSSQDQERSFKRKVAANDEISYGDVISLPITISAHPSLPNKAGYCCSSDEIDYIQSLKLYMDSEIIALNKPHGLAVQGGIDIKLSMDVLAAACLKYEYKEPPLLVHRLDKDSSGILVLARNQISAAILHSIFREKTFEASRDIDGDKKFLQRKYWALVIGRPRHSSGKISEPLKKVVLGNRMQERIAVSDADYQSSQVAITEYKVIGSHQHGCTWLELCPRTGRKHQLRVHCAEVLGTPILGDFKYGWHANKRWASVPSLSSFVKDNKSPSEKLPFGLNLDGGSILDEVPWLHLHCKEMKLPDISVIIQQLHSSDKKQDHSKIKYLDLVAPLPCHMQRSWDIFNELSTNVHLH